MLISPCYDGFKLIIKIFALDGGLGGGFKAFKIIFLKCSCTGRRSSLKERGYIKRIEFVGSPFFGLGRLLGGRPCSLLLLGVLLFADKPFFG